MFDDFTEWDIEVAPDVMLHGHSSGTGPAVVLLHGHPRTHLTWHRVAPALADAGFSVICPDLRGYGRSSKPEPDERHHAYCDRTMAADTAALMSQLGHDRFAVVGHDRGCGVAYRTALDHADRVTQLAVLDGVPYVEAVERTDASFATRWWHWFFFAGSPHAERVINADPVAWYELDDAKRQQMGDDSFADLVDAVHDPRTVRAMLEDYRAGLSVDAEADRDDRAAGRTIAAPTLVGWSGRDDLAEIYGDPVAIWRQWISGPVRGVVIDSGHHMAEQNPEQLTAELLALLRNDPPRQV